MMIPYLARLATAAAGSNFRPRVPLLGEARLPSRAWPTDIDPYLHVNNGRYLTLMDFARFDHALRTGVGKLALQRRWWPVAAAATVQFRRELKAFQTFEITTRIAAWDTRSLWVEHRFERQGTVHTWAGLRLVIRHRGRTVTPQELLAAAGVEKPEQTPSPELERWISSEQRGARAA